MEKSDITVDVFPRRAPVSRKAVRDMEARVAKTYAEAESYAEFDLKRAAFAPRRVFFEDMFRMRYFYSNGRAWLYGLRWAEFPFLAVSAVLCLVSATTCIGGWASPASFAFRLVSVTAFCAAVLYSRSLNAARKARRLLRDIDYDHVGI